MTYKFNEEFIFHIIKLFSYGIFTNINKEENVTLEKMFKFTNFMFYLVVSLERLLAITTEYIKLILLLISTAYQ